MKTNIILKFVTLIFILLLSGTFLMAQSKEQDEKAEQQAIMEAEMKAKKEMLEQQEKKMRQMEIMYADQARSAERAARSSSRSRSSSRARSYRTVGVYGDEPYVVAPMVSQNNQSQLTLRNSFDGNSSSSKGGFDVSEETHNFRVMINGRVKSAEITYSQSLTLKEGEESKYIGTWNYEVKATFAEGNYMLQMMTH